jgi:Ca2+-binding RTX toxin-like protein
VGDDKINGGSDDDVIYAGFGDDTIDGGIGTNQLFGEDGNDIFIAGAGIDTINGGDGSDTISYVNSNANIAVNLATNLLFGGDATNDNISSIENITGSSFNDTLIGNSLANILNGGSGNDNLAGGNGCDVYIYNFNSGTDIITETGNDADILRFSGGIIASDLSFVINGDDLEIQVGDNVENKVIIKNQITQNSIETIKINPVYNISKEFFIINEDEPLIFSNPLEELNSARRNFKSLNAVYGTLIFDEILNKFTYQSNANFHGIDEITLTEESGNSSKFTVFVNGVNDAPIFCALGDIPNKEVKVEEEWSVNLKDYFVDVDNYLSRDDLSISLTLKGFDNLPDWINFNSQTGIVSGKIGRDGKLNFTATATDRFGANLSDNFYISITRNICDDIIPSTSIVQINGTDSADIITATPNSSDIILGGAGDDIINYTKDNDWAEGNNGSYFIAWNVYSGDEIAVTGKQRSFDAFDGGDGYDKLNLTDKNDVIFLDDSIVSNIGDIAKINSIEEIDAGDGDDVIDLTSLNFIYNDIILSGGNGNDVLWGNDGNDILNGDIGDDNLQGGKGDDIINGGIGNDLIKGYDGDDKIIGEAGFDVMIGGNGNDQFIFTDKSDSIGSLINLREIDIIFDFVQNEDKIDFSALNFNSITQGQNSNSLANGLEFYFKEGYTIIDDPNSNFAVKLTGEVQLSSNDFNF